VLHYLEGIEVHRRLGEDVDVTDQGVGDVVAKTRLDLSSTRKLKAEENAIRPSIEYLDKIACTRAGCRLACRWKI
jgi:hypothetical protein